MHDQAPKKANRLARETSTYLQQHAYNPVDWYPWGPEALNTARQKDLPILLSVGYAACHWCHVMEHESFEDEHCAALMNENFINIKVDREERTDIDEIYMKAVQLMVGHGGWPMTVFLTPDLKPFFGGTYFPPQARHGLPSFKQVLTNIASAWRENRDQLMESGDELTKHLKMLETIDTDAKTPSQTVFERLKAAGNDTIDSALEKLLRNFDKVNGGFGGAPKFPHTFSLDLAMRVSRTQADAPIKASRRDQCLEMITTTLDKMALGGLQDHLGGGFARYATDRKWLVPHFEKMLYDNALLAKTYFDGHLLTGNKYWQSVGESVLSFVKNELMTPEGAFYSSLDADSEGVEGKFYVFTRKEIDEILGLEDGAFFSEVFGITELGNFEHGTSILNMTGLPEELSQRYKKPIDVLFRHIDELKARVKAYRDQRVRPGRDEKVLVSWNSLMIQAYISGYKVTANPQYLEIARRCAMFILDQFMQDNRLSRVFGRDLEGNAVVKNQGCLDDYAYLADALIDMASIDPDPIWLLRAGELLEAIEKHFYSKDENGYFYTADDHESLLVRPRSHFDGSTPSGTSAAVMAALKYARLTDRQDIEERALAILDIYLHHLARSPEQFANLLNCLDFAMADPIEVVIAVQNTKETEKQLLLTAHRKYLPNKVALIMVEGQDNPVARALTAGKTTRNDETTIYICRNKACQDPISDLNLLKQALLSI